jgi:hypothetical protein
MEPIKSHRGIEAARMAASKSRDAGFSGEGDDDDEGYGDGGLGDDGEQRRGAFRIIESICVFLLLPFLWLGECFVSVIGARLVRWSVVLFLSSRRHAYLFLNGMSPFYCSARLTIVNLVVLCSIWYMFIDQVRLALFPIEADDSLAVINFGIWIILVVELVFEVFIRPDGYSELIVSDKAFTPMTVRFISGIHLVAEAISLVFFIPEFLCLFTGKSCDDRTEFSFFKSALLAVAGPDRGNAFAGRVFFACIRLRVFGLVRHWKNMYVNTTFHNRRMKQNIKNDGPERHEELEETDDEMVEGTNISAQALADEQRERDAALIHASNIGTALLVTNSYRALIILCVIMGFFPIICLIYLRGVTNPVTNDMIFQLQATNILVTSETVANCEFLVSSVDSWMNSWASLDRKLIARGASDNFLFSLEIQPSRCTDNFREMENADYLVTFSPEDCDMDSGDCIIHITLREADGEDLHEQARSVDLRVGAIQTETVPSVVRTLTLKNTTEKEVAYSVVANFNRTHSVEAS